MSEPVDPALSARRAEEDGDWERAERLWRDAHAAGVATVEVDAGLARVNEKRRIFGKVASMLPGRNAKSYIGPQDLVTVTDDAIEIRFHLRDSRVDLKTAFGALRRARLKFEERCGHRPELVRVDLCATRDELHDPSGDGGAAAPAWAVATAGERIRVALDGPEGDERHRLVVTLTHEFVHLALREMTAGRCPRWLDEGLAMALSQELPDRYRETLRDALAGGRLIDLAALEGDFAALGERDRITLAYAQSASLVEFLLERDGVDGLRALVHDLADGLDTALARRGESPYLLEREWARWAREHA